MNLSIKRPTGFQIYFLIVLALSLLLTLISICAQKWATTDFKLGLDFDVDFNLWSGCQYGSDDSSDRQKCDDQAVSYLQRFGDVYIDWIIACRWLMFFSFLGLLIVCGIAVFMFLKDPEGVVSTLLRIFLMILVVIIGILQIAAVALGAVGCFTWITISDSVSNYAYTMSLKFGWYCALLAFLAVGVLNISSCVWVCCLSRRTNHGGGVIYPSQQGQPQYAPSPYNQPQNVHYQPQTSNIAFQQQQPQYPPPQQQQAYYQPQPSPQPQVYYQQQPPPPQ